MEFDLVDGGASMAKKVFGVGSSIQRQVIASGLTAAFTVGTVGSSYVGGMDLDVDNLNFDDNLMKEPKSSFFKNIVLL